MAIPPTFEVYRTLIFCGKGTFIDHPDLKDKLETYLHLTQEEYDEVIRFATENDFKFMNGMTQSRYEDLVKFNGGSYNTLLKYELEFPRYNSKESDSMRKKLFEFTNRTKKIATSEIGAGDSTFYSVHLLRSSDCRDNDNYWMLRRRAPEMFG